MPTILLVDDEKSVRETVRAALQSCGNMVLESGTYGEAVRTCERHSGEIGLLITDIALPDNNGYELAARLLTLYPKIQVLFTSGQTGAELCKFYNMTESDPRLLKKPFEMNELLLRVESAMGSRSSKCQANGS